MLTLDIGVPHLERHLAVVTALMRASSNWSGFIRLLDKAIPVGPMQGELFELDGD